LPDELRLIDAVEFVLTCCWTAPLNKTCTHSVNALLGSRKRSNSNIQSVDYQHRAKTDNVKSQKQNGESK
jgi:hypothetical protein